MEYMKVSQVAAALQCTSQTVLSMIRQGELVAIKTGPKKNSLILVEKSSYDAFIARSRERLLSETVTAGCAS
jgi:excisionase family DNA binding protein